VLADACRCRFTPANCIVQTSTGAPTPTPTPRACASVWSPPGTVSLSGRVRCCTAAVPPMYRWPYLQSACQPGDLLFPTPAWPGGQLRTSVVSAGTSSTHVLCQAAGSSRSCKATSPQAVCEPSTVHPSAAHCLAAAASPLTPLATPPFHPPCWLQRGWWCWRSTAASFTTSWWVVPQWYRLESLGRSRCAASRHYLCDPSLPPPGS
jgi:hypothetical protein